MPRRKLRFHDTEAAGCARTVARRRRYRRGLRAETAAALLLRLKGYRILARRARTPLGEIDLVARRGSTVAFVEVKQRHRHDEAVLALHPRQIRRLAAAARWWLAAHPREAAGSCRFDLVTVNRFLWPRHHVSVFGMDESGPRGGIG
jgi:putative endonuclease